MDYKKRKKILYYLFYIVSGLAIIYFTPNIVTYLSDGIISWTKGSEVWIAFFTGGATGITIGIILTCTWLDLRCKYCEPINVDKVFTEGGR